MKLFDIMGKKSAGILFYRLKNNVLEVFLVHPGGPFWAKKDLGVWSIPKGEFKEDENPLDVAKREVKEELCIEVDGNFIPLTPIKQKSGKVVYAWALEFDIDPTQIKSNTFEIEWPPKSGKKQEFPEINRCNWFNIKEAKRKINPNQLPFIEELIKKLNLIEKQTEKS